MKKVIDHRFLLTPFATTKWCVNNVDRKYYYIFGFKIADIVMLKHV